MKQLSIILLSYLCFYAEEQARVANVPIKIGYTVERKNVDAYTKLQYGNMPLIISAPHGGKLTPSDMPDRTCPGIKTGVDLNTSSLLLVIDSVAKVMYHIQPSWVYTDLARLKLDENRPFAEATCSNPALYTYWNNYHNSIDSCITKLLGRYPQCIFIDLHGHGHKKQSAEIGYLFSALKLRNANALSYNGSSLANGATLFGRSVQEMINGSTAFGTYMSNEGFPCVPSAADAAPTAGDPYFDGGYNTEYFTGNAYPKVIGWQIETNFKGVRDNYNDKVLFAKAFMRSIITYFKENMQQPVEGFGK